MWDRSTVCHDAIWSVHNSTYFSTITTILKQFTVLLLAELYEDTLAFVLSLSTLFARSLPSKYQNNHR